jgi:S1-C subfamily serine protease
MDAPPELAKQLLPAIVNIHAQIPAKHPSAGILGMERMGTGTIIDPNGLILTVNYVVMGSETIWVALYRGRRLKAEILAQDFDVGLALLKVKRSGLPSIEAGSSTEVHLGREIFVLASTGPEDRRVSGGVVTYVGEFEAYWEYRLERGIVTSAANPGFGGGPMLSMTGQMVGVTSLNLSELTRCSLAIPIECYLSNRDELVRYGRLKHRPLRAWLGLFAHSLDEGVVVAGVVPGGPAERSGLKEGDLIVSLNAEEVPTRKFFYTSLWRSAPGDRLALEVMRDQSVKRIDAVGGDRAEFYKQGASIERPKE